MGLLFLGICLLSGFSEGVNVGVLPVFLACLAVCSQRMLAGAGGWITGVSYERKCL